MNKKILLILTSISILSCSVQNTSNINETKSIASKSPNIITSHTPEPTVSPNESNSINKNEPNEAIINSSQTNNEKNKDETINDIDISKEKIAFLSNFNEICTINPDGTHLKRVKLLNKISFNGQYQYYYRWSPNHKKLLYLVETKSEKIKGLESYGTEQYSFDIQVVNFDGTDESKIGSFNLASVGDRPNIMLSWSPDSNKIAFMSNEPKSINDLLTKRNVKHNIFELDKKNKVVSKFIVDNIGYEDMDTSIGGNTGTNNLFLKWSPDSKMVLFNTIRKSNTQEKEDIQINYQEIGNPFKQQLEKIYGNGVTFIEWSEDAKNIFYDYGGGLSIEYSYSLATKKQTEVFKSTPYFSFLNYKEPITKENISPDNKKIAYECSDTYGSGICLNDGLIKNVTTSSNITYYVNKKDIDSQPGWSLDSKKLFFISKKDNENGELYIINTNKSDEKRLTSDSNIDSDPVWVDLN